jgi:CheY-like chemotaxis protein
MRTNQQLMKILVVHRQKEVVNQIKMVLHENEPFIRFSDSGLDGLLAARVENFDLIICGTDLPVITGFEVVRSLRTASINRNATVLFLLSASEVEVSQHIQILGASAVHSIDEIPEKLKEITLKTTQMAESVLKMASQTYRFN